MCGCVTVMAGDQLVHSGYLQALACLSLGLRLDRVLCYTETAAFEPRPPRGEGGGGASGIGWGRGGDGNRCQFTVLRSDSAAADIRYG